MKEMEALFDELSNEDGEFQLPPQWDTKTVKDEVTGLWKTIIDPDKDCFEIDGYRVWWYHAENLKHPDTPVVLVQWTSNHKEDV